MNRDYYAKLLREKDAAQWTSAELDKYLGYALWSVYSTAEIYKDVMGYLPQDPQWLLDVGLLKSWPLNPYDGWRPMRLLTPEDGFSPGAIVWQLSPDSPLAYELGIYGRDAAAPLPGRCQPLPQNAGWARVPPGVRYTVGAPAETMSQTQQRILDAGAHVRQIW